MHKHLPYMVAALSLVCADAALGGDLGSAIEKDWHDLHVLSDPQFNGGIRIQDAELAARLADDSLPLIGGRSSGCGRPDIFKGMMMGNLKDQPDPHTLIAQLPAALQETTRIALDGSPVQRAVALRAIADMGTAARSVAAVLGSRKDVPGAWEAEALGATSCQPWGDGGIQATVPAAFQPPAAKTDCDDATAEWVLDVAADRSRIWPGQFLGSAWNAATAGCERDKHPIDVSPERVARLKPVLLDPKLDHGMARSLLSILADLGPPAAAIAPDLMPLTDSPDEELAWQAQRAVVSAGVPQAVPIFRQWLLHDHVFNWAWRDYVARLAPYRDQIVPALAAELKDELPANREAAASALGELKSPDAIPALLVAAADNNDWPTSQAAINALAPFAASHPDVHAELQKIASQYWSGRIRLVAKTALETGHGIEGDPFSRCNPTPVDGDKSKGLGCIEVGMTDVDHHMPKCRDGKLGSGHYKTAAGKIVKIEWIEPKRIELPRGKLADLSGACNYGSSAIVPVKSGWVAGCSGFEFEGMLVFVPADKDKPFKPIYHMGVRFIPVANGKLYVVGEEPIEFGDGGALDSLKQNSDGTWDFKPVAVLPSDVAAYAVVGDDLAFSDDNNAVLFDPNDGISALSCTE